ncbi:hypothetical protein [Calothrix sp. NIES-2098]
MTFQLISGTLCDRYTQRYHPSTTKNFLALPARQIAYLCYNQKSVSA